MPVLIQLPATVCRPAASLNVAPDAMVRSPLFVSAPVVVLVPPVDKIKW